MLAGRKLLLADDSITIQKVVDLTFADEGIKVVAVNNGTEAIEKLEEVSPDVVLADVFMPGMTGYQVCEYIKKNQKLKDIPVVLLVGSFEPFDEAEARRVGADDILTKPFQSIRNLIDKVGALMGREKADDHQKAVAAETGPATAVGETSETEAVDGAKTLELPKPGVVPSLDELMSTSQLNMTTADTKPLSAEMLEEMKHSELNKAREAEAPVEDKKMESHLESAQSPESNEEFDEALLDLGEVEHAPAMMAEDDILDIDFDSAAAHIASTAPAISGQSAGAVESSLRPQATLAEEHAWNSNLEQTLEWKLEAQSAVRAATETVTVVGAPALQSAAAVRDVHEPQWSKQAETVSPHAEEARGSIAAQTHSSGQVTLAELAPEVIDAIARRVVEQLSDKAVQEIAWEVVPPLAELLIKRKLEEKDA